MPGQKIVVPEDQFYLCLQEWLKSASGQFFSSNIKLDDTGKIIGYKDLITPIASDDAFIDGPKYLADMRKLLGTYGIEDSYAYSPDMLTMEMFNILLGETAGIICAAAAACFFAVLLITAGPRLGAIVTSTVLLTVYFLLAWIKLVGL